MLFSTIFTYSLQWQCIFKWQISYTLRFFIGIYLCKGIELSCSVEISLWISSYSAIGNCSILNIWIKIHRNFNARRTYRPSEYCSKQQIKKYIQEKYPKISFTNLIYFYKQCINQNILSYIHFSDLQIVWNIISNMPAL